VKNTCKRKCHWNYNGECVAEDVTHITDGTQCTVNCSMFLEKTFFSRIDRTVLKCHRMLNHMDYADLRKAKHLLSYMEDFFKVKELQTPVSPEWVARIQYSEEEYIDDYRCPICGLGVAEDYTHCPHCGRKLNWQIVNDKNVKVRVIQIKKNDVVGETLRKILDAEAKRFSDE
jgi:hypothetical protein